MVTPARSASQHVEELGTEPREMPDAGMSAAADQITVARRDLAARVKSAARRDAGRVGRLTGEDHGRGTGPVVQR
ncbi:hypothetical protein ACWD0D_06935 [Streptomyces griseoincarnatus]